jgi:hypothetical protein
MMEKLAQAGEGGDARPPPFTIFAITYKVAVSALFLFTLWSTQQSDLLQTMDRIRKKDLQIGKKLFHWFVYKKSPSSPHTEVALPVPSPLPPRASSTL